MKYYWIALTIEIKMACHEINTKNYVIFADFKFFRPFFIGFLSNFIDFLSHVIDRFYNIFS